MEREGQSLEDDVQHAGVTAMPSLAADDAEDDALHTRGVQSEGGLPPQRRTLKLFHGTRWDTAKIIRDQGFVPSVDGCLGPGIYLGREGKARRFAADGSRHGGEAGGLLAVIVRVENPKFVTGNDTQWQEEGYDACRTEFTSASSNMEWALRSADQVLRVLWIEKIDVRQGEDHEPLERLEGQPLTAEALQQHTRRVTGTVERRQFNCAQHGTFWKKVLERKPVARCKECPPNSARLEAIPKMEERGRGHFICAECGHAWFSNSACRGLAQACTADGCSAYDRQVCACERWVCWGKRVSAR
jgi:hypothetical protein